MLTSLIQDLSPESQFLLACLKDTEGRQQLMQGWIRPDFNWNDLFQQADRHALIPVVHRSLNDLQEGTVPEPVLSRFRTHANKIWARNSILKNQLMAVLQKFQASGIAVIPYKGPILADRLYGHIGLRCFDDLDLLIHKEDIFKAKQLLLSNGYKPKKELESLTAVQEKAFLNSQYTYDFISRNPSHHLEVHWEILPRSFSLQLDCDGIWKRSVPSSYENLSIPVLSTEDLILILCIMGAKKLWNRLSRVYDIARSLFVYPDPDWPQILKHATEAGAERILSMGLWLAFTLFEVRLPESLKNKLAKDPATTRLSRSVLERMFFQRAEDESMIRAEDQFQPLHFQMRERFRDRLRYCLKTALTPGVGEWAVVSLPSSLYVLYYFLRPVRLAWKAAKRLLVKRGNH